MQHEIDNLYGTILQQNQNFLTSENETNVNLILILEIDIYSSN